MEFEQQILEIRRVTRVVKGGRRFSFAVSLALGDRAGRVGLGTGKAADIQLAIEKAARQAKKEFIQVPLTEHFSIPYEVRAKDGAAAVFLKPARAGRGLTAGGPVRAILELAGVRDAAGKILHRSKNKLSNARATMKALTSLQRANPSA